MSFGVGIDIGSVSLKIAAWAGDAEGRKNIEALVRECFFRVIREKDGSLTAVSPYYRINGQPVKAAADQLKKIKDVLGDIRSSNVIFTGSGGRLVATLLGASYMNEFKSVARAVAKLEDGVRTVFEMGGENAKYVLLSEAGEIEDYETNGDCAAGTGSFLDQQASRLKYKVEDIGKVVLKADKKAHVAGRCSVFAKSDMIHAQQKGYQPNEILKGLCEAVARNFKSSIVKGKPVVPPVAFVGGLAMNEGVILALRDVMGLEEKDLIVPEYHAWASAVGCAFVAASDSVKDTDNILNIEKLDSLKVSGEGVFPSSRPLSMDNVELLRDRVDCRSKAVKPGVKVDAFLGIDIGSVSTNLVVIDTDGEVIHEIYLRTRGRPIEAVDEGLQELKERFGDNINILGVGTTGSGRELIGQLVGADTINDEITAHKTGADFISSRILGEKVDTIFEIGGQDSKFIRLQDGIVVDFTMNEACAAGTGSFLEEQAEKLGVSIKGEFANLALSSEAPIRLGERCTVFMEQDVVSYQHKGAAKEDLIAGLAYSVVLNYLNRVVRGRPLGNVIFFQGGTAYNDAVAAAFASVLGKRIIVPPHNGVMGAIGEALLAREKYLAEKYTTKFRGFDIKKVPYRIREFTCHACPNKCDIQEFTVENVRTYWGDKCSEKYRTAVRVEREPVIPDLIAYRDKLLWEMPKVNSKRRGIRIGIPRHMYFYERFPFWSTYFAELGFDVVVSDPTNKDIVKEGLEAVVAQPCFPIEVAHGHAADLLKKGVDYILVPNQINAETNDHKVNSHVCPWGQTLPFVMRRSPRFAGHEDLFLIPVVEFRRTREEVASQLYNTVKKFGISKKENYAACVTAFEKQDEFKSRLLKKGAEALRQLRLTGEPGIVLVGRPYNLYDRTINLNIPAKLRKQYGANVIPMDFLPLDEMPINDVNDNMYWNYGRKILQAAKITAGSPNLHLIYFTNFKCGPDSYIKQFAVDAAGKPFLTLQFDGHGNDAGMMTRVEAYLDSKGVLRWWSKKSKEEKLQVA